MSSMNYIMNLLVYILINNIYYEFISIKIIV